MKAARVAGLGFWAPGVPNPQALLAGSVEPAAAEPPCALLPGPKARRATALTRMLLEVAEQAGRAAQVDLATVRTVFATARGEMGMVHALLEMLQTDGALSPIRFHNSVYNTASGYFSIATGNRAFTTTLTVGEETLALALLEAFCLLEAQPGAVLVALGDEAVTIPFIAETGHGVAPFAAALCLRSEVGEPGLGPTLGRLSPPHRAPGHGPVRLSSASDSRPETLRLVRAIQGGVSGPIEVSPQDGEGWLVELTAMAP